MNEQPGDVLDEAVKLFDALRRKIGEVGEGALGAFGGTGGESGGGGERGGSGGERGGERGSGGRDDDVWSRATAEDPHIATGAPECRNCPICRAIALARESGPDVRTHVTQAGQSLFAAALDVVSAYDRTRTRGPRPEPERPRSRTAGSEEAAARDSERSEEAVGSPGARRSGSSVWADAVGDDPIDIG
ncbi:hypothetical protein J4573_35970 [Actinomadura barringtoniae]|uniref:Uncharacterized protein n=1 Tax=Actinomadura barringtoniae TaxID=1427535 RepID=A0A939PH40_9ACTN|nr:hypothetical protein [Actinomadura barringtoniae]MBO2452535.1 hypothetical protein [Actinomadura barringtoniae]